MMIKLMDDVVQRLKNVWPIHAQLEEAKRMPLALSDRVCLLLKPFQAILKVQQS